MPFSSALYYPHFTPSVENLRGMLLFYDDVRLMVPEEDQWHVRQREHVSEILEISGRNQQDPLVNFIAPEPHIARWSHRYQNGRGSPTIEDQAFERLVRKHSQRTKRMRSLRNLEFETGYWGSRVLRDTPQQMELLNKLSTRKTSRWRYISAQKVSEELLEELTENRVALPAKYAWHPEYDQPIEVQPVLMVEEIVDFIVSRLARDVSFENDLFSLTFSGSSYLDHVYKSDQRRQERNSIFLSFAVPTLIPKNVGSLRIGDYLEIREMYSPLRKEIGSFAGQLVEANFLDDGLQQKKFLSRLDGAVRQVQSSLEQQEKLIAKSRIHNTTKLVLGVGGSIVGAGIGGILGDLYGAAAGSVLGHFLNGVTDKYSSAVHSDQDGFLRNTAMMHAAVEQRLNNSVPTNSNTWL